MNAPDAGPASQPGPSPQFEKVRAALRRQPMPIGSAALEQLRLQFDAGALPVAGDVNVAPDRIGGLPVEVLTAPGAHVDRTVVYLHGGGYVMGSIASHRNLAGEISRASGARVVIAEYPLAPEHPFPAAINALTVLYEAVLDSGVRPQHLAVAGDSAGAGLALATLVNLRTRGQPMPAGCVTISAYVDLARTIPYDPELVAADPIVTPGTIVRTRDWYLGRAGPGEGLAAVAQADLNGLPPMLIQVGGAEILLEDSLRLARQAEACGVPVTLEVWPHMVHVWHAFGGRIPESAAAVNRAGEFIRAALHARD